MAEMIIACFFFSFLRSQIVMMELGDNGRLWKFMATLTCDLHAGRSMEVRKLGGVYRSCIGVSIFMYSHESGASK
jgi:hypothetical protein